MPANKATPQREPLHGHCPFPQKQAGHLPVEAGHAREQGHTHPNAEPFTGMARSHKKQAGHLPVEAGHAREQGHTLA